MYYLLTYIHTATKVYGLLLYGSSLLLSIVLNEIYRHRYPSHLQYVKV